MKPGEVFEFPDRLAMIDFIQEVNRLGGKVTMASHDLVRIVVAPVDVPPEPVKRPRGRPPKQLADDS